MMNTIGVWAEAYATGADLRYTHWASYGIWITLVVAMLGCFGTASQTLGFW